MATYQSNDYFPEGGNYKAGDIVYSPAGAPVAAWIHTGRDFVPYHKAENYAIGGVTSETNLVTGGVGIIGPAGEQVAGNAAPYAFTTRAVAHTDNGMNLVCATAQTATVNTGLPAGFGCSFEGAISFTAGDDVTITDLRSTGATDIFCGLMQTGANTYKVRGGKA